MSTSRKVVLWGFGILIVLVLLGALGSLAEEDGVSTPDNEKAAAKTATTLNEQTTTTTAPPTTAPPTTAPPPTQPTPSISQQNALQSAEQYLDFQAFSFRGLIEQLQYEGYSLDDAAYAIRVLDPDWNEQAAKSAKQYLEYQAFSRSGLIDQLIYEGFSREQAQYGVSTTGL